MKTSNKTDATDYKNYPDEAVSEVLIKTVGALMTILEILKNTKNNQRAFGLSKHPSTIKCKNCVQFPDFIILNTGRQEIPRKLGN